CPEQSSSTCDPIFSTLSLSGMRIWAPVIEPLFLSGFTALPRIRVAPLESASSSIILSKSLRLTCHVSHSKSFQFSSRPVTGTNHVPLSLWPQTFTPCLVGYLRLYISLVRPKSRRTLPPAPVIDSPI